MNSLSTFLSLSNEILTSTTVIIAASLLLWNLTRNLRNRVARTSSAVLACVTIAYICDVFVSLDPSPGTYESVLRLQWIGIAFMPATMFHLSDALLATTGLPSRGRRRRVTRLLYSISIVFLIAAAFTNVLVLPMRIDGQIGMGPSTLFPVYTLYFVLATSIAFINVQRARQRCLTRDTRRRMGYLQIAMITPALGIFPFSVVLGFGEDAFYNLLLVNASNIVVILMLLFLAYPLSFFGSSIPDRVVKAELLRFVLRGPATGMLALAVIIYVTPATRVFGLTGQRFTPFAVVAVVLFWQWVVHLAIPWLEKKLIYPDEDDDQLSKLQNLSDQILTHSDLMQLLEATLAACCDYLQVNTAFAVSLTNREPELISAIGPTRPNQSLLKDESIALAERLDTGFQADLVIEKWFSYWVVPLYSRRGVDQFGEDQPHLIGFIGIQARSPEVDLTPDERDMFQTFIRRAAQALDDLALQRDIYAALEGLLPQMNLTRTRAAEVEYRQGRESRTGLGEASDTLQDAEREQFVEQVRAALRHLWGGPGLTHSQLLQLHVVNAALPENDNNPAKALRMVLEEAIKSQRPEGERRLTSPEWTIYNILDLRFIEGQKVRDVAKRMALSEPDLYRKQRIAIEAVADTLLKMNNGHNDPTFPEPLQPV